MERWKDKKKDDVDDVAQQECSNNKYYTSADIYKFVLSAIIMGLDLHTKRTQG